MTSTRLRMPLRPSGRRKPDQEAVSGSDIGRGGVRGCARMEVKGARALIQVTGKIMQVNPGTALDGCSGVPDAHAKLQDGFIRRQVTQRHLMPTRDLLNRDNLPTHGPHNLNRAGGRIVNQGGDVVVHMNLEAARRHLTRVILCSTQVLSMASQSNSTPMPGFCGTCETPSASIRYGSFIGNRNGYSGTRS